MAPSSCYCGDTLDHKSSMAWYNKILGLFVKDAALRKRFIDEFNFNARNSFENLSVDALLFATICPGKDDSSYRHDLSAPRFASGIEIQLVGGVPVPLQDVVLIGQIVLLNQSIVRRMYILHWDTLIIRDMRTGHSADWRIKDFAGFGGLLY